jgi:N-acetylmuramoyl-L-alanine amidase
MKVIIDNGHGIDTAGKRSPAGMLTEDGSVALFEYAFNRDIAARLIHLLHYAGITYYQLVPELEDISLIERVRRANEYHKFYPDSFLISIHANLGGGRGLEYFTYFGQTESDVIAEFFAQDAKITFAGARLRTDVSDGDSDKEANFYILRKTNCPAVLTENFFMDNVQDLSMLLNFSTRQKIAQHHFNSIVNYINSKK